MITIDYHPVVSAVVEGWRRRLPIDRNGLPREVTDDDLRELISRLTATVEIISRSVDTGYLLSELARRGKIPAGPGLPS